MIARAEVGDQGTDTRFITINLKRGRAKALYETIDVTHARIFCGRCVIRRILFAPDFVFKDHGIHGAGTSPVS